jgi:hypothetical protein
MGHMILCPGDNAGSEAAEYCRAQRVVAVALRKIIRYPKIFL